MSVRVSSVTILGLNGRKHCVKVTPNTSILQVLEEACKMLSVNPSDYDLKHGKKTLDVSMTVGLANLTNNALLELQPACKIRKEGNVTIRMVLESGESLMGDFSPSSSIWDVVCHCLNKRSESPNHGDNGSAVPVCVYMRQVISGEQLKEKTLRSLGLTCGTATFRFSYRPGNQLHQQAHVSAPLRKSTSESVSESNEIAKSDETGVSEIAKESGWDMWEEETPVEEQRQWVSSSSHWSDSSWSCHESQTDATETEKHFSVESSTEIPSDVRMPENICLPELTSVPGTQGNEVKSENLNLIENFNAENSMDVDSISEDNESAEVEETATITVIGKRNAVLFNLDDVLSMPKVDLPDDFFEITIDDVRYLFKEHRRARSEIENKPLELQSQKQNDNLQHQAQYAQTVIRVQFPERLVLQGVFSVHETVKSIEEFVRGFLENKELNFYLYTSPPKTNLLPEKTLLELKLLPAALVYFGCEKNLSSYFEPSYKSQVSDPRAVSKAAAEFRSKNVSSIPSDLHSVHVDENVNVEINLQLNLDDLNAPSTSDSQSLRRTNPSDSKMPKWLKLGKK